MKCQILEKSVMFPDSILFSWLIQDSANCSFVQSIFGHELDGKSNVVNLSCKEIVAIFTTHVRDWILGLYQLSGEDFSRIASIERIFWDTWKWERIVVFPNVYGSKLCDPFIKKTWNKTSDFVIFELHSLHLHQRGILQWSIQHAVGN